MFNGVGLAAAHMSPIIPGQCSFDLVRTSYWVLTSQDA